MSSPSTVLGKRSRSDIAAKMFKAVRNQIKARPRTRTPKPGQFEGVRNGVAISGSSAPEIKDYDVQVGTTSVVTGTPYILSQTSAIAEGAALGNRVGAKILLKSVDIEMNVTTSPGVSITAATGCQLDVFVVWDKQPSGSTPTVGAILVSPTTNLTFGNTNNLERFVVLRRKSFVFDVSSGMNAIYREHIPLSLACRFGDATGAPQTNDIYVVAVSPNAVGAGNITANISYVSRVKFTDA